MKRPGCAAAGTVQSGESVDPATRVRQARAGLIAIQQEECRAKSSHDGQGGLPCPVMIAWVLDHAASRLGLGDQAVIPLASHPQHSGLMPLVNAGEVVLEVNVVEEKRHDRAKVQVDRRAGIVAVQSTSELEVADNVTDHRA